MATLRQWFACFRGGQVEESLAFAKADHSAAYKQLPVCEERKRPAAVSPRDPRSNEEGGFAPQTQLFGATAAALDYNTVSRVMATVAARCLKVVRRGYFGAFGIISIESCVQVALKASTKLNVVLGFDSKVG